jgi:hypothetical protein
MGGDWSVPPYTLRAARSAARAALPFRQYVVVRIANNVLQSQHTSLRNRKLLLLDQESDMLIFAIPINLARGPSTA